MQKRNFSIYFAERRYRETFGDEMHYRHHACLMLMDESGDSPKVVQQLHFNENNGLQLTPNVRNGISSEEKLNKHILTGIIGGEEKDILARWNAGLKQAAYILSKNIDFDPDYQILPHSRNCRTGVISSLKSMGLEFCYEFAQNNAGTTATLPIGYTFNAAADTETSLKDLWDQNEDLAQAMPNLRQKRVETIENPTPADLEAFWTL